jgi:hypothetical protein
LKKEIKNMLRTAGSELSEYVYEFFTLSIDPMAM